MVSMPKTKPTFGFPAATIREGKIRALVPRLESYMKSPSDYAPSKAPVFYNPVMELNRDFAVLALRAYQKVVNHWLSICEPLASVGIRGVRFAAEVDSVERVLVNDISKRAAQVAEHNVHMNKLQNKIRVKQEDANVLLSSHGAPRKRFDAIDVDPFGSPVPYIDSAIRSLKNRGFIALTATDMAPLCGVHPKACIRKYGGKPLRTEYCHELAVRLLAGSLTTIAAKHEIGTAVAFSHSAEHYIRVYATVSYGAKNADRSLKNIGYVLHCFKCFHRESVLELAAVGHDGKCIECGSRLSVAGPLWLGRLADRQFARLIHTEAKLMTLNNSSKIEKILALTESELEDSIGYYVVDKLCDSLGLPVPAVRKVTEAIRKEGFDASATRFNTRGIRSMVPALRLQCLLREIVKA